MKPTGTKPGNVKYWGALIVATLIASLLGLITPSTAAAAPAAYTTWGNSSWLDPGKAIFSPNREYKLGMQTDGNLVLRRNSDNKATWHSRTKGSGAVAVIQWDGDVVVLDKKTTGRKALYRSGTNGTSDKKSEVQITNDGKLLLVRNGKLVKDLAADDGVMPKPTKSGMLCTYGPWSPTNNRLSHSIECGKEDQLAADLYRQALSNSNNADQLRDANVAIRKLKDQPVGARYTWYTKTTSPILTHTESNLEKEVVSWGILSQQALPKRQKLLCDPVREAMPTCDELVVAQQLEVGQSHPDATDRSDLPSLSSSDSTTMSTFTEHDLNDIARSVNYRGNPGLFDAIEEYNMSFDDVMRLGDAMDRLDAKGELDYSLRCASCEDSRGESHDSINNSRSGPEEGEQDRRENPANDIGDGPGGNGVGGNTINGNRSAY